MNRYMGVCRSNGRKNTLLLWLLIRRPPHSPGDTFPYKGRLNGETLCIAFYPKTYSYVRKS